MIKVNQVSKNKYIKMLIAGFNGCGKTTLIKTLPKDAKILYICFEDGINSVLNFVKKNKDRIDVLSVENYTEDINNLCNYPLQCIVDTVKIRAENEKLPKEEQKPLPIPSNYKEHSVIDYDFVFVDSLTSLGKKIEYEIKKDKLKPTFDDWNQIGMLASKFLFKCLALNSHVIFLGHVEVDSNNSIQLRLNGNVFKGNILDEVNCSFYYNVTSQIRNFATVNFVEVEKGKLNMCKTQDELGVLDYFEDPDISQIIEKLTSNKIDKIKVEMLKQAFLNKEISSEDFKKFIPDIEKILGNKKPTYEELANLANNNLELKKHLLTKIGE